MMEAYRLHEFTGLDGLRLGDEPEPLPQRGEVLVGVAAVSLNFRDIAMMRDQYPVRHRKGLIPTSDAAGNVLAVGPDVDAFRVGDRVTSTFHPRWFGGRLPDDVHGHGYGSEQDGWLTRRKVVSQESLVRTPDSLSDEEAATLPCAAVTAWAALTGERPIRAGDTVLVQGTGGVSVFALQLAKAVGARVIATTSSAAKADRLRAMGADAVVNYRDEPNWGDRVRDLAGGRGVDRVVEVGGPGTMAQSLRAVVAGGEVAAVGFLSADDPNVDFFALFGSWATFRPIAVGSREATDACVRTIAMAGIRPVIGRAFDFAAARDAYDHLGRGAHVGKVVVRCGDGPARAK